MIGDQVSHLFNVFFILCHSFLLVSLDLENASLLESVDNMLEDFPAQQLPRETFNAFVLGVSQWTLCMSFSSYHQATILTKSSVENWGLEGI